MAAVIPLGEDRSVLITATESAPASITSWALAWVIPPMATRGNWPMARRTARKPSRPRTGAVSLLVVVLKIGPIKATFNGEVTLKNLKPPHSYTIQGEGKGGIAGFAKGGADVTLTADGPEATILKYAAKADVGGKIAQLGSRLIESTSKKLAGQFFSSFGEKVGG